jgi:membrane peptidoglycan carboxypeptidase
MRTVRKGKFNRRHSPQGFHFDPGISSNHELKIPQGDRCQETIQDDYPFEGDNVPDVPIPTDRGTEPNARSAFPKFALFAFFLSLALMLIANVSSFRYIRSALAWGLLSTIFATFLTLCVSLCKWLWVRGHRKRLALMVAFALGVSAFTGANAYALTYDGLIDQALVQRLASEPHLVFYTSTDGGNWTPAFDGSERSVSAEEIGQSYLRLAIIAVEDERFLSRVEGPIDFVAVARASVMSVFFKRLQGGSTIQNQIAKLLCSKLRNTSLSDKRTQAIISFRLDQRFQDPNALLAIYVNLCQIDSNKTGIGYAAADLFGVSDLRHLTVAQSALLAGMLRSPTSFDPRTHRRQALERRAVVLLKMLDQKMISEQQYSEAEESDTGVKKRVNGSEMLTRAAKALHRIGGGRR